MRALELKTMRDSKSGMFLDPGLTILAHLIVGILKCVLRTSTIFWSFLFLSDLMFLRILDRLMWQRETIIKIVFADRRLVG